MMQQSAGCALHSATLPLLDIGIPSSDNMTANDGVRCCDMRFSVVATVRNERQALRAFLDSLLQQSLPPDEIVIVDGASTDGTLELLQQYATQHRVQILSQACNIAQGRNLGIALANGTHIAVTDAGCRISPDWLEALAGCFAANPDADVVAGNFRFETHTSFEQAVVHATFPPNRDVTEGARLFPSSRSVAFKKLAWARAGGYPEWLYAAEDTLFNIRLRQVGCQFVFCRNAIVHWRPRETWRALAKQRRNFAQGNARVGIGTDGYVINLKAHATIALLAVAALWSPWFLALSILGFAWHVRRRLWPQATKATRGQGLGMRLRVVVVMEYVRVVNLWGFLLGRWERMSDSAFVANQRRYMGVASVDELDRT